MFFVAQSKRVTMGSFNVVNARELSIAWLCDTGANAADLLPRRTLLASNAKINVNGYGLRNAMARARREVSQVGGQPNVRRRALGEWG